ncbi:MAG: hypothetical protein ACLPR9_09795 [Acidimicrobiales bacterium]|jgi:hypothetical protein
MAPKKQPTAEDRHDAVLVTLNGLASGSEFEPIIEKLGALHIRHNTFPAEELLELASDAIDESGATTSNPIDFEKIRDRFLPEHRFSGKNQHYKSKYAITAAAMIHGGVYPDLLDDAAWWQTDDLWVYSFFALLIFVRAAAERTGRSVEEIAVSIANRRMVQLDSVEHREGAG